MPPNMTKARAKAARETTETSALAEGKVRTRRKPRLGTKSRARRPALISAIDKPLLHPEKEWFCYMLTTPASSVPYIGKTCDLARRLREHNGELVGGAKKTHRVLEGGATWERQLHVWGFPDERAALNFEWAWEHCRRRAAGDDRRLGLSPLERGLKAMRKVLEKEQPTSVALPFSMYAGKGVVVVPETSACTEAWARWGAGAPHLVTEACTCDEVRREAEHEVTDTSE